MEIETKLRRDFNENVIFSDYQLSSCASPTVNSFHSIALTAVGPWTNCFRQSVVVVKNNSCSQCAAKFTEKMRDAAEASVYWNIS